MKERVYTMTARAAAMEQTGTRIVDAMLERFAGHPYDQVRLEDIASDSGVTVQTVIRRFGSKAGLMRATIERELGRIVVARENASRDEPGRIVSELVTHYEAYGALILKVYAEAGMIDGLDETVAAGRAYHLSWCRQTFEPLLATDADTRTQERRLAQITAACDATTWRILRIDCGLDLEQTRMALLELVEPLMAA
jgi:AcrR family transcriptional regulator